MPQCFVVLRVTATKLYVTRGITSVQIFCSMQFCVDCTVTSSFMRIPFSPHSYLIPVQGNLSRHVCVCIMWPQSQQSQWTAEEKLWFSHKTTLVCVTCQYLTTQHYLCCSGTSIGLAPQCSRCSAFSNSSWAE